VVGYSHQLKPRILEHLKRRTFVYTELCIRVFVTQKVQESLLPKAAILPKAICDIPVDVVVKGEFFAPPKMTSFKKTKKSAVDKTKRFRPVPIGVSVGHWNITAGSLGIPYDRGHRVFLPGTNAHVGTPDPSMYPEEIVKKRILQPGAYHGGQTHENVVGEYLWHKRIRPLGEVSDCQLSHLASGGLNFVSKTFQRKTRFVPIVLESNYIDFMVYTISESHCIKIADESINLETAKFIGHLFAGSDLSGVICKVGHIIAEGFKPRVPFLEEIIQGDTVKGVSFWCNFQTIVEESSASLLVNYGGFQALFEDVILIKNDGTIKGGWSGSPWFKV